MTNKHTLLAGSGAALIGSFLLSVAGGLAHPIHEGESHTLSTLTDPAFPYAHLLIYVGALLLMIGLPGAYLFAGPALGRAGRIGLALYFVAGAPEGRPGEQVGARQALGRAGRIGLALYFVAGAVAVQGGLVVEGFVLPAVARDPAARHLLLHGGTLDGATWFNTLMAGAGTVFLAALVLLGIGLVRSRLVPRVIGVLLIAGALLLFVPLPEVPVLTGLLIEVPRGLAVAALGVLMIRSARPVTAQPQGTGATVAA